MFKILYTFFKRSKMIFFFIGSLFRDPGPDRYLFSDLGPYWVLILPNNGSLLSLHSHTCVLALILIESSAYLKSCEFSEVFHRYIDIFFVGGK